MKKTSIIILLVSMLYTNIALSQQIPTTVSQTICHQLSHCPCPSPSIWSLPSSQDIWNQPYSTSSRDKMNQLITLDPNIGGGIFTFGATKKIILRSSLMSNNPLCLSDVIQHYHIKTIVNLYDKGYIKPHQITEEMAILKKNKGTKYIQILNFTVWLDETSSSNVYKQAAKIINNISDTPGNILIHCFIGAHDTGVIYGILQKCFSSSSKKDIQHTYFKHTGYVNKKNPGVAVNTNLQLINEFPCDLVSTPTNEIQTINPTIHDQK